MQGGEIDLVREPVLDIFKKVFTNIFDEGDTLDFLKIFQSKNVSSFTSVALLKNKTRVINIEPDYHF